jgi:hypothetical protein
MENDWIDYLTSPLFQSLVDYNMCVLPYIEGSSRYDKQLYDILRYLLETGKLHPSLLKHELRQDIHYSMCLTGPKHGSRTRNRINRQESAEKPMTTTGMPISSKCNLKKLKIANGHRMTFHCIEDDGKHVLLKRDDKVFKVPMADFMTRGNFDYGFCDSVFRYQGHTIREPYNIYDVDRMSLQDIYTALSRFTTADHIFLDSLVDRVFARKEPDTTTQRVKIEKLVFRIYRITAKDTAADNYHEYIGYTSKSLQERFKEHLDEPTSVAMREWLPKSEKQIALIEELSYLSLSQVLRLEAKYIAAVSPDRSMNTQHKKQEPQNTTAADQTERCKFVVPTELPARPRKRPTPKYDAKNKRYRVQISIAGKNVSRYSKTLEGAELLVDELLLQSLKMS